MMTKRRKPHKKLNKSLAAFWRVVSLFAVCAAMILAITIFFKITAIEVTGAERISADAIIEASGIKIGDNLFLLQKTSAENRIKAAFGYAESVYITRTLPDTIVISVTEAEPVARIPYEEGFWLVNLEGRLLEYISAADENTIPVAGCTLVAPRPGENITGNAENTGAEKLIALLAALETEGILDNTNAIDLTKSYAATFRYDDRFSVCLGAVDNLDYKISYMLQIISSLESDAKGTIDLSQGAKANFVPDKAAQD